MPQPGVQGQEYVDALNNERQYLCAAGYLDLAEPHGLALVRHLISGRASRSRRR